MARPEISRRDMMRLSAAGVLGGAVSGWAEPFARATANDPQRRRSCILLWMNGGPSQIDTFDLKPGHANGGPFREIQTRAAGVRISEHLPKLAEQMDRIALIRTMSTREGDHSRGTYYLRTGYLPQGAIQYPPIGAIAANELGAEDSPLPPFVSIAPFRQFSPQAYGPGFLGPQFAPLLVGDGPNVFQPQPNQGNNIDERLRVRDLHIAAGVSPDQFDARVEMLQAADREFVEGRPGLPGQSHVSAYDRAVRLMRTGARTAFDLDQESTRTRDNYGRNIFGQGCLLARRLVERGVPFVEVTLGVFQNNAVAWDTHQQNFPQVRQLSEVLDQGWAALMEDLRQRGMLDDVLIVWMGEFGRTPRINPQAGRDHFPNAWTAALCGAGIKGGAVFGRTTDDGMSVNGGRAVAVPDLIATICRSLGIDPEKQNMSNIGRPIRVADVGAQAVREILR
jgi:hypothetical protein